MTQSLKDLDFHPNEERAKHTPSSQILHANQLGLLTMFEIWVIISELLGKMESFDITADFCFGGQR